MGHTNDCGSSLTISYNTRRCCEQGDFGMEGSILCATSRSSPGWTEQCGGFDRPRSTSTSDRRGTVPLPHGERPSIPLTVGGGEFSSHGNTPPHRLSNGAVIRHLALLTLPQRHITSTSISATTPRPHKPSVCPRRICLQTPQPPHFFTHHYPYSCFPSFPIPSEFRSHRRILDHSQFIFFQR